jgi:hypothetical protein
MNLVQLTVEHQYLDLCLGIALLGRRRLLINRLAGRLLSEVAHLAAAESERRNRPYFSGVQDESQLESE